MTSNLTRRISTIVLILAIVAAMGVVCTFGFTNSEDEGLITRNPNLNPPTLAGLGNHWREPHLYLYIPMTYTAWWVLAVVGNVKVPDENGALLNPWLFHSANLLLHIACSVMVLNLLRRLIGKEGPALLGAMLFALHPIQVEAVAWTTGTKDVLCGAFSFAALLMYVKWRQQGQRAWFVSATIALVLALLSKPAACVVPVMAYVIDWLLLGRDMRAVARSLWLWVVITIPFLVIVPIIQPAAGVTPAPLWARPLIAGDALAFYLWKIVWPFGLSVDYARPPRAILASGSAYWMWLIPAALAVILLIKRDRRLGAAGLIFLGGLLPVLGLTTFIFQRYSTVADRFVYLSMFGVALAAAWALSQHWRRPIVVVVAVVIVLLGIRSTVQSLTWRNRHTLYSHAVKVSPHSAAAHSNWGLVLRFDGELEQAEKEYRRAIEIDPDFIPAHQNLANVFAVQQRTAEMEEQLKIVERLEREHAAATQPSR